MTVDMSGLFESLDNSNWAKNNHLHQFEVYSVHVFGINHAPRLGFQHKNYYQLSLWVPLPPPPILK